MSWRNLFQVSVAINKFYFIAKVFSAAHQSGANFFNSFEKQKITIWHLQTSETRWSKFSLGRWHFDSFVQVSFLFKLKNRQISSEIKTPFLSFPWELAELNIHSLVMDEAQFHITEKMSEASEHPDLIISEMSFHIHCFLRLC